MEKEAKESITSRLSLLEDLYFPRSTNKNNKVQHQPSSSTDDDDDVVSSSSSSSSSSLDHHRKKKQLLLNLLLSTDPALFLERYGSHLSLTELSHFDILKSNNYEVNWHLNHLRKSLSPTPDQIRSKSNTIKNRRLAYINDTNMSKDYFSEDAMRERQPYLHYEYLGKFQEDFSTRGMARAGEKWSDTLIRRSEEAVLVSKIRTEQQRLGVPQSDWIHNNINDEQQIHDDDQEEVETDSEADNEKEIVMKPEEVEDMDMDMGDRMEQFLGVMKLKFLSGEDHEHFDYDKIDGDESLDDHWIKEADLDAEEKYFDNDDE